MTKTLLLYLATAVAEIVGCYLPYCYVKRGGSALLLIPAALSLAAFVGLLMLHPAANGRVYAAYGGVYILTALLWLRFIDGIKLSPQDWLGAAVILCGVIIMISGWRNGAG
ncbi:YnfA family protein [Sodalis sp.]|uniref:YnfA family protein n=1 Tax=Sodalis sp. (in: enterobacteria) TaxID=1898979 RepID=UPI0038734571